MKKVMVAVALALALCHVFAGSDREEARYRKTGGLIALPATGALKIVNAQGKIDKGALMARVSNVKSIVQIAIEISDGEFDIHAAVKGPKGAVYVIDDSEMPMSLLAPEGAWGMANVCGLTSRQATMNVLRVAWSVLGATTPCGDKNPLGHVDVPADLDALQSDMPEMQEMANILTRLPSLGITPPRMVTYKSACRDGVAPPPTNDVQRAIFAAIKAEQSEKPVDGIKIKYNPKVGR